MNKKYSSILPTQEELITFEQEDEIARKALNAKARKQKYKSEKEQLNIEERSSLLDTPFYRESLISALTLPEFLEEKVDNVRENTKEDLFNVLSAKEENLTAGSYSKAA